MNIPSFSANEDTAEIVGALQESGCVVVTDITNEDSRNKIKEELAPCMAISSVDEDDPAEFYPGKTRRMSANRIFRSHWRFANGSNVDSNLRPFLIAKCSIWIPAACVCSSRVGPELVNKFYIVKKILFFSSP